MPSNTSASCARPGSSWIDLFHLARKQDWHFLNALHEVLVDMGQDRLLERPAQIGIFLGAALGATELKEFDLREERPESLRGGSAMRKTEIIIVALRLGRLHIGKVAAGPGPVRCFEEMGRSPQRGERHVLAELQHDEACELVGGIGL